MSTVKDQVGLLVSGGFTRTPDAYSGTLGSTIAGKETLRAILNQRSIGRTHLFVPNEQVDQVGRELLQLASTRGTPYDNVAITPVTLMPGVLQEKTFLALHNANGPRIGTLAYARARLSRRIVPITFAEYGFSYQPFLMDSCLPLLFTPSYACDSMICTTEVARRATRRILERLKEEFLCTYGKPSLAQFQLNVIPHGVDLDYFRPRNRPELRVLLELPQDKVIVIYSGRLSPCSKSDIVPLLMAFQKTTARYENKVALLLVGPVDENYKPLLNAAVDQFGLANHVIHRENVPQSSVPLYYSAADVFVSLSDTLQENFGLTPVEAMASGLPAVVSDWAGYQESVIHNQTGFKVRSMWSECDDDLCLLAPFTDWSSDHFYIAQSIAFDVDEIAEYLDLLIGNDELRKTMGERARQHAYTSYSWERSISMMWSLWQELDRIAETLSPVHHFPNAFYQPRYFQDFSDFAVAHLNGSTRISLTERGRRICDKKEKLLTPFDPGNVMRQDIVLKILRFLKLSRAVRFPVTLQDLEHFFGRKHGLSTTIARRHIMWMLKYDLARMQTESN